jgi:hypothetical protein
MPQILGSKSQLAHNRPGVDPNKTKEEMTQHLSNLRELTKQAIKLQP